MNGGIDAVLMASGFSERFGGGDKLLALFRGKPLARHTLELACGMPEFHEVFFVAASEAVAALAEGLRARVIRNERPGLGQGESIRLGAAASTGDYCVFFPCDQPLLDQDTVRRVLAARSPGRIVQPSFRGSLGTPALFARAFREELLALQPGESGRTVRRRHSAALVAVELDREEPLLDIDTPEMLSIADASGRQRLNLGPGA